MSESDQDDICRKCGRPTSKVGSGRMTEWIKVCNCNAKIAESNSDDVPIEFCGSCGKRIAVSRSGSFTQWIFRPDYCSCSNPSKSKNATGNAAAKIQESDADATDELTPEEQERHEDLYGDRIPLERYRVIAELGRGSAGTVFLCRDLLLRKKVAIKSLNTLGNETLMAFQQEARSTSKLNHPNIVRVIDFGSIEGSAPYMVLEFFDGISLDKLLLEHGRLSIDFALSIVLQMCDALAYTHKQRIWHRDLKPSNVLVSEVDNSIDVRLIDFGIAIFKPGTDTISPNKDHQYNTLVGTPPYMSPDQALGKAFDARSEIYSLGCVFFEMLTGRPPFVADTPLEMIALHAQCDPPSIFDTISDTANMNLSALTSADDIIQKCLAKNPDARYQSVAEFKSAVVGAEPNALESVQHDVHSDRREDKFPAVAIVIFAIVIIVPSVFMLLNFALDGALFDPDSKREKNYFVAPHVILDELPNSSNNTAEAFSIEVRKNSWHIIVTSDQFRVLLLLKSFKNGSAFWFVSPVSENVFRAVRQLKVKALAFDGTRFSAKQVQQLCELKTVYLLVMLNSFFTDDDVKRLSKMTNLSNLVLQSAAITDVGLKSLADLPNLRSLVLTGMMQVNDDSIDTLLTYPSLMGLGVPRTGITKSGVIRLIKSGKFKALDLAGLDQGPDVQAALQRSQLERLGLSHTKNMTPEMYQCLAAMKKLQVLDLRFCPQVTESQMIALNARRVQNGLKPCTMKTGTSAAYPEWDFTMYDE